jgi:hypothetical protein
MMMHQGGDLATCAVFGLCSRDECASNLPWRMRAFSRR